jgi:Protein of unknown function (DUF1761)
MVPEASWAAHVAGLAQHSERATPHDTDQPQRFFIAKPYQVSAWQATELTRSVAPLWHGLIGPKLQRNTERLHGVVSLLQAVGITLPTGLLHFGFMTNHLSHLPWLGVVLGSLAFSVLGGLWFAVLFKNAYAAALERTDLADQKPGPLFIVGPLLCGVVITITNALLMQALEVDTLGTALLFGLVSGLGYLVPMTVNIAINPNFPRPFAYSTVTAPYFLIGNLANVAILSTPA